jgi:esterase/lipase
MRRKSAIAAGIVTAALLALFLAGPRVAIDTRLRPLALPADLDRYLTQSEARFPDIVPGTEKKIIWANAAKAKTPWSVVYVHGFSATRQETAPLCDRIAAQLRANLFYTRLAGHGRGEAAMAEATVNDWFNDATEAYEIGKRLGDRVIVIGTSTGATLATWLAEQPNTQAVAAYVLISPNFAPKDRRSEILAWPWGEQIARLMIGRELSFEPSNAEQARYWTHRYPTKALVPMMGLVRFVRQSALEGIRTPTLMIFAPNDDVLDVREVEQAYARLGSSAKQLQRITNSDNLSRHVLAGDILAPRNTPIVAQFVLQFVASLK